MAQCPDCDAVAVFSFPTRGNGKCSWCQGDGKKLLSGLNEGIFGTPLECNNCDGSGECPTCDGTGEAED